MMSSQSLGSPDCWVVCPYVAKQAERVEELEAENEELKKQIILKEEHIKRLWNELRKYKNPHTPPSRRFGSSESRGKQRRMGDGKPGRKQGHEGITRPQPEPDETIVVSEERCPGCGGELGEPVKTETRVIEDVPEPQQVKVTEFKIGHYNCPQCNEEVIAGHEDLPPEGRLGYNVVVQTTLYKYHGRLVHRKTGDLLNWLNDLGLSSGTIFDLTRRASDWLRPHYRKVWRKLRKASVVYVDETGIHVNGEKGWIWTFASEDLTLFAIRMSRGTEVLEEILGENFEGWIVCDGWSSYPAFTSKLQRCWAHLLREVDELECEEGRRLAEHLHKLYDELDAFIQGKPPPEERKKKKDRAMTVMRNLIEDDYKDEGVVGLIGKIQNGFDYWFTFVTEPGVEPTNNRAERALREHVIQRKIIGTLRNEKGMRIHETITTMLATWKQKGLDPYEEMHKAIRS